MGAAIGGWLAAIGLLALALPFVQTYAVALAPTVPILSAYLVAIAAAYLVGGYMAGRAAGSRTGWHGLLTGILTLAVVLALTLFSTTLNPVATWMAAAFPSDAVRIWVPDYGTYPPGVIAAVVIVLTAWLRRACSRPYARPRRSPRRSVALWSGRSAQRIDVPHRWAQRAASRTRTSRRGRRRPEPTPGIEPGTCGLQNRCSAS